MIGLIASPLTRGLFVAALVLGAVFSIYTKGRTDGKNLMREAARVEAGKRIVEMEKANETFRNLSARERCLAFMRDSGLPEQSCD